MAIFLKFNKHFRTLTILSSSSNILRKNNYRNTKKRPDDGVGALVQILCFWITGAPQGEWRHSDLHLVKSTVHGSPGRTPHFFPTTTRRGGHLHTSSKPRQSFYTTTDVSSPFEK